EAVAELQTVLGNEAPLAAQALRWILLFDEVSCVIPGASSPEQILANLKAADLPALSAEQMQAVREVYDRRIRPLVHFTW
ncbi:MAG: aldo/keto reductase, partial [Bacteroidota bacterium]|nr:aldo/keto reductase [Bacteroidota bacterium]